MMKRFLTTLLLSTSIMVSTSAQADEFKVDYKQADLLKVIEQVSIATGKNFIVGRNVKAKITMISARKVSSQKLYELFLGVLQVNGFAAIEEDGIVKIVQEGIAKQAGGSNKEEGPADQIVTRVVEVEHISASEILSAIRPLVPSHGHIGNPANSNILIISDRAANVDRIVSIVRRIDQASDEDITRVRLKNANATDIVPVLEKIGKQTGGRKGGKKPPKLVTDARTNSIMIVGDRATRNKYLSMINKMDEALPYESSSQVVYLRYAKAPTIAPILERYAKAESAAEQSAKKTSNRRNSKSTVAIQADEQTNSLVITAPPKMLESLQGVIKKLDVRRAQVLVEAIIAEVSDESGESLGVQLAGDAGGGLFASDFGSAVGLGIGAILGALQTQDFTTVSAALPAGVTAAGSVLNNNGNLRFAYLINALDRDANTQILSTPSIVALDNEEAQIKIGREVPFITGSFTNTGNNNGATNPFQTIERKDVGITLKMTPHVIDKENVQLVLHQEVSSISAGSFGASDLVTDKREIDTSVIVRSGEMIALGGLMDEKTLKSMQKVPLLGDIPILGTLFRNESETVSRQNLMIFVRPVILHDGIEASHYTEQRRKFMERSLKRPIETPYAQLEKLQKQAAEQKKREANQQKATQTNSPAKTNTVTPPASNDAAGNLGRRFGPRGR